MKFFNNTLYYFKTNISRLAQQCVYIFRDVTIALKKETMSFYTGTSAILLVFIESVWFTTFKDTQNMAQDTSARVLIKLQV